MPDAPPDAPPRPRLRRAAVVAVVAFHLGFLLVRNVLDLGGEEIRAAVDDTALARPVAALDQATWRFGNLVGCEQDWRMFGAYVAERGAFLAWRLELSDGTSDTVLSPRDPGEGRPFFRVGGWQRRNLEDHLLEPPEGRQAAGEWPLWPAAVREQVAAWRQAHPDDPRSVRRVVLVRRWYDYPPPGRAGEYATVRPEDVLAFAPDGGVMP